MPSDHHAWERITWQDLKQMAITQEMFDRAMQATLKIMHARILGVNTDPILPPNIQQQMQSMAV